MRLTAFIAFTVFHLVASALFGVLVIAIGLAAIDGQASAVAVRAVLLVAQLLFFPIALLSTVVDIRGLGRIELVAVFLANSFVWAALAAVLWSWYRRRRERASGHLGTSDVLGRRGAL
jgi:uncharacterized membrane protein